MITMTRIYSVEKLQRYCYLGWRELYLNYVSCRSGKEKTSLGVTVYHEAVSYGIIELA